MFWARGVGEVGNMPAGLVIMRYGYIGLDCSKVFANPPFRGTRKFIYFNSVVVRGCSQTPSRRP